MKTSFMRGNCSVFERQARVFCRFETSEASIQTSNLIIRKAKTAEEVRELLLADVDALIFFQCFHFTFLAMIHHCNSFVYSDICPFGFAINFLLILITKDGFFLPTMTTVDSDSIKE